VKLKEADMNIYNLVWDEKTGILSIGFGEPATNCEIVPEAIAKLRSIEDQLRGEVVKINGAASVPVAIAIGAQLKNICKAIAVFDPKLQGYVVSVSFSPDLKIGDLI
jgi:CRISPR-associated protein Csx3